MVATFLEYWNKNTYHGLVLCNLKMDLQMPTMVNRRKITTYYIKFDPVKIWDDSFMAFF